MEYLERAQGLDTEAVSLDYLLGRIGHHKAYEAGLTAGAYRRKPRLPCMFMGRGGMRLRRVFNQSLHRYPVLMELAINRVAGATK